MTLLAVRRCPGCNAVEALVSDGATAYACRINAGYWWCACQPERTFRKPTPAECCPHLYALGSAPRSTA